MTTSVGEVKNRLDHYNTVERLAEDDKRRFFAILKHIENSRRNGMNYLTYLKKHYRPPVSNAYLEASIQWLKEKGYLVWEKGRRRRILLFLTDKARQSVHWLDDYLSYAPDKLSISSDLQMENIVASLSGELHSVTKKAILSNQFIRNRLLELSAALIQPNERISLEINVPAPKERDVLAFLKVLWEFYWIVLSDRIGQASPLGPLCIDMDNVDEKDIERYSKWWRKHLQNTIVQEHLEGPRILVGKTTLPWRPPEFWYLPQAIQGFVPLYLEKEEVRRWVSGQLDRKPDWFMPHYFWVKLGFEPRRENLKSVDNVSPPMFFNIPNQLITQEYSMFNSFLRWWRPHHVKALVNWIVSDDRWTTQVFYESWRIIRREYMETIQSDRRLREVARILDQALLEYIIHNHVPSTDLKAAFTDFVEGMESQVIAENKYPLET